MRQYGYRFDLWRLVRVSHVSSARISSITDLSQELTVLTERLGKLNEDLARKIQARNEYDAVIGETEAAYMKVRCLQHTLQIVMKPSCPRVALPAYIRMLDCFLCLCAFGRADPGVISDSAGSAEARGRFSVQARRPAAVKPRSWIPHPPAAVPVRLAALQRVGAGAVPAAVLLNVRAVQRALAAPDSVCGVR